MIRSFEELNLTKLKWQGMLKKKDFVLNLCFGAGCISGKCEAVYDALILALEEADLSKKIKINQTGCIGACDLGPSMVVMPDGVYYCHLSPLDMKSIVNRHLVEGQILKDLCYKDHVSGKTYEHLKDIPFFKIQEKIVLKNCGFMDYHSLEAYIGNNGYHALHYVVKEKTKMQVIEEVSESGLRGRGGGGFPTGHKWLLGYQAPGDEKYIICNADEGDPGAFMDRCLLEGDPHAIIEGMAIGAYAIGAQKGYIYIRAEYPLAVQRINHALLQAREEGLLGTGIFGTTFDFDIEIRIGAGAFVCGEETALIHSIEGKRGEPRQKPPFPTDQGLYSKPTVINNVETFANVPNILLNGPAWFKSYGSEKSTGTKVFAIAGAVNNAGIIEVPMGTSLGDIIFDISGGMKQDKKFKAAQTGGPSGGCLTTEALNTPVDYESLKEKGAIMGSGGMIVMDEDNCMVDVAKFFMEFVQDESCGKCVPCRLGTKRMLEILEKISRGQGSLEDLDLLEALGESIKASALCGLGQTAPNPVLSTIKYFRQEYEAHILQKHCQAGVCRDLFLSPCQNACPAGVNVPGYLSLVAEGRVLDAFNLIRQTNPFPAVCGRVCTHPCESKCQRSQLDEALSIADVKRYVADKVYESSKPFSQLKYPPNGKRVAIIGAGPSGLTCAYFLAQTGYEVTVFEKDAFAGGILRYGIPEYRLPKSMLQKEIDLIRQAGVDIRTNVTIGMDRQFEDLKKDYDAIYISTGTQVSNRMNIVGENLKGVVHGLDFLRQVNGSTPPIMPERVVVVGGGSTAMDAARSAIRLGAKEVKVLYRRTLMDMPADHRELIEAREEGVQIETLIAPTKVMGHSHVESLEVQRFEMGPFDTSGRRKPIPTKHGMETIHCDMVIIAVSQHSDLPFVNPEELEMTDWGTFVVDTLSNMTKVAGIFAGGDVVRGPDTAIYAIADGRKAAYAIHDYLGLPGQINIGEFIAIPEGTVEDSPDAHGRFERRMTPLNDRVSTFREVSKGYHQLNAMAESMRCLRCDRR